MENATKAWIGHGVVQTNPETYQKTIYSKDAPTNQVPGTVQEYAAFEAGPRGEYNVENLKMSRGHHKNLKTCPLTNEI